MLIGWLNIGFNKVETFKLQDLAPKTKFSIIIPFRDEAEHLSGLLQTLKALNYPKNYFEILFVNDASSDESVAIINKAFKTETINFKIIDSIRLTESPKKDAITTAINLSKFNWILTTDADCLLPKYWLDCYDEFIQTHHAVCIAGPVKFVGPSSFFNRFQIMDTLSLQGATIGGFGIKKPFLCNGANFAYKASEFKAIKGFEDHNTIASGDDVFLLESFVKQYPTQVHYLKTNKAIVATHITKTLSELTQQRLRWASKTSHYKSLFVKGIGLIVLTCNLVCITLIPLVLLQITSIKTAALLFVIKFSIDLLLLFKIARFFKQETILLSYTFASFIYPFYNCYIAILSLFTTYQWKGRTFKK